MRNPFARTTRTPAPDVALLRLRQQVITLTDELRQAHATVATLRADNAQLRNERDEARCNYEFYYDEYRRNYAAGGKHAMSDAMHATYANNDALAAEVQRLRDALAAATARIAELEADLRTQEECNYLAEYRQAVARAEAAEAKVVAASEVVYDLIGELADASGRTRAEIEAEFLSEVRP